MTGQTFNRWTVLERTLPKRGSVAYVCRCTCGVERVVVGTDLRTGHSQSCGCRQRGGDWASRKTHGRTKTTEYTIWQQMRSRCGHPGSTSFHNYGGRGIAVCDRWHKFENFYADMGDRPSKGHSLDRINNDGHYEPSNCRWATRREQGANIRKNRVLALSGVEKPLAAWAADLSMHPMTLATRLDRWGWTVERALTTPVQPRHA